MQNAIEIGHAAGHGCSTMDHDHHEAWAPEDEQQVTLALADESAVDLFQRLQAEYRTTRCVEAAATPAENTEPAEEFFSVQLVEAEETETGSPVSETRAAAEAEAESASAFETGYRGAPACEPASPPAAATPIYLNSKRVSLNYEVKDVGPSGISLVELWYTREGKDWHKYEAASHGPPYVVEVDREGRYGFSLVARSGLGLGKKPPQPGDLPQVWIEVDLTRPVVQLLDIQVGMGPRADSLSIHWNAADKNFAPQPITLSYAEEADGPWVVIAANLENSGQYLWPMGPGVPQRFHVRVEATDLAGNTGMAQTPEPLLVDLAQPTVSIVGVAAAG